VLGASAGLLALVTFVGGAMLWIRFDRLDLAADQSVARLPNELLVVVGAHALVGPVVIGLVVAVFLALLGPLNDDGSVRPRFWVAMAVIGLWALVTVVALIWHLDFPEQAVMLLAVAGGAGLILAVGVRADRARYIAWAVFAVFAVGGGVLLIVRTLGDPRMEPVAVLLSEEGQRGLSGFFVGETADRLFLAPLPGSGDPGDPFADAQIDRIVSLSRDKVARLAMREPIGIDPDDAGRDQAQSLLVELQQSTVAQQPTKRELVTTINPVVAFAPLVHLHSRETLFPMSAQGFLDNAWLGWRHDSGCRNYIAALGNHDADAERREKTVQGVLPGGQRLAEAKLGTGGGLQHFPADQRCRDQRGAGYRTAAHTRPYDRRSRPAGLPQGEGFFLDLRDDARVGHDKPNREGPQTLLGNVPVYFESHPEARGTRITYWLFYGLSKPPPADVTGPISHEGDWERISVLLRRSQRRDQYIPLSVRYHFHDESRDVPWYVVKRVAPGGAEAATHPVVFSARGSHASYPRAGRYENEFRLGGRRRFAVHDDAIACPRCPQWQTWRLLIDATKQPWYGFGGAWGKVGGMAGTTGPLGPSRLKSRGAETPPESTVGRRTPVPRVDDKVEDLLEEEQGEE